MMFSEHFITVFIFLTLQRGVFYFVNGQCNIPLSFRVKVGDNDDGQTICDTGSLCYEMGYGCYLRNDEVPGFKRTKESMDCGGSDIASFHFNSVDKCSRYCFERSNCVAFLIVWGTHCFLKYECVQYKIAATSLHRLADSRLTCFIGGFDGAHDVVYNYTDKEIALNNAKTNNRVIAFTAEGLKLKSVGSKIISKDHKIFDNDNESCEVIEQFPITIRFPWPTSNTNKFQFKVDIKGQDMMCYSAVTGDTNGVVVYIPLEHQIKAKFEGEFFTCKLTLSSPTNCQYSCICGDKYCQAFYVNMVDKRGIMKVCEVTTIL
ncbi:DgyrCDS14646 [Dimorphilus gyrociliatus]|uniref:DgyrCDS14646 n=1 Tax=Dimorphilus gyrociliatus TaxID=2664684 RepID=A0A7I8WER9_9ANNE|nr:DgyrCDS14646 [Dimorphilus gyrociliatus]